MFFNFFQFFFIKATASPYDTQSINIASSSGAAVQQQYDTRSGRVVSVDHPTVGMGVL